MEARTSACIFLSLTRYCATLPAQQVDYYQAPAPADASNALAGGGAGQGIAAGQVFDAACGSCATTCGCCEPWRLFPQCEGGLNFYGWLNAGFVGNMSDPASKFNGPYNAVDRSNELMLNQMYFVGEKDLDCDCFGIGGRVDVIYGEDYFLAQSVGLENHDDGSPALSPRRRPSREYRRGRRRKHGSCRDSRREPFPEEDSVCSVP